MFKRIVNYYNKYFGLFDLIEGITDSRTRPQIACSDICTSIISMLLTNLGSLNRFNQARDISSIGNIAGRVPSASTVARAADTMDLDCLREILKSIYLKAKRSKMIEYYCGKWIGIIDGHEITSSDIHKCDCCSVRNVSKIEGQIKLNYYHRYTAFILAEPRFCFLLDIEPIYPNEGELTSALRLLERVCLNYPKAFEAVAGDAYYLNGPTFKLLDSHHKSAIAVLKDETRELYGEAVALSKINKPFIYEDKKTVYRVWEHAISGLWDGYKSPVRVIRSEEAKTARHHCQDLKRWELKEEKAGWMWVTKLPSTVDLKNIVSVCHSRWQIENKCFNEIVNT